MIELDIAFVTNNLVVHKYANPIEKNGRPMYLKHTLFVKKDIDKYHKIGFIESIDYSCWLSNIIHAMKANEEMRYCTNFRDVNKAYPKDNFSLPHMDMIADSIIVHEILSFMYDFLSYNEIWINKED